MRGRVRSPEKALPQPCRSRLRPPTALLAAQGYRGASPEVKSSVPVGLRSSRTPLPPWLWPAFGLLKRGACTRPEPLRRSAAHVSSNSAGVAASRRRAANSPSSPPAAAGVTHKNTGSARWCCQPLGPRPPTVGESVGVGRRLEQDPCSKTRSAQFSSPNERKEKPRELTE